MADRYVDTPGLDRLAAMQRTPIGATRLLGPPSAAASQYRQQASMYGQALRNLSRAARRGDARAGIMAVDLRDKANEQSFTPGGVRRYETFQGKIAGREQAYQRGAEDLEAASELNRQSTQVRLNPLTSGRSQSYSFASPDSRTPATDTPESYEEVPAPSPGFAPTTRLGQFARQALGDTVTEADNLRFRQGLDRALGQARTPEERSDLQAAARKVGITDSAFDRRAKWWETNRR